MAESGITDEEVHAIAALLRGNSTIAELNLRGNEVCMPGFRRSRFLAGGMGRERGGDIRGGERGRGAVGPRLTISHEANNPLKKRPAPVSLSQALEFLFPLCTEIVCPLS